MKVNNNKVGNTTAGLDTVKSAKGSNAKGVSTGPGSKVSDLSGGIAGSANVNVSERAQMMQKAKEIASDQTVDEAKVARLQKMIDEGKYNVDAKAVADRLVDAHLAIPD